MDDNKEYIISGTADQIVHTLVHDFKLSEDISRFIVRLSTEADNNQKLLDRESLNLWYLGPIDPCTSPVLNTPFSISFTSLKKEMATTLFLVFGNYVFTGDAIASGQQFILEFLIALWSSITKIEKNHLCVYYRIIDVLKLSNTDSFGLEDVIPYDKRTDSNECNCRPQTWTCPYWYEDICRLTESEVMKILDSLSEKGVLLKNDKTWSIAK